ncbi:MAG: NifB/NifX family molybdenum-iron cluster-binding protein [Thermoplasmata archaeon]|jgi:predicted Fe-Mo cluster-binding NifX family protein|nr:NifB/NifX family molybdenum-iron cluster-binding protein [Thermoplasmata archaeon]MVT13474.1 dinitrogenase iron-molybdenum cofactor biosynthesis protein [Euryarchaeota archaeon]
MRICLATSGAGGIKDYVSPQFGRCPTFTIVDIEDGNIRNVNVIQNPGAVAGSGAGIQAAQIVVNSGCQVVIAGAIGPNSYQVLMMGRVDMRECPPVPVEEAIRAFLDGKLRPATGMGGPGMGRGMGRGRGRGWGGGPY